MDYLIFVLELFGTVAFAISGAMTAVKKRMDLLGVLILGITTAVGGGVIRDLILGINPPMMFRAPVYALTAALTSLLFFIPPVERFLQKNHLLFNRILLWMDSIGLGIFTVVGIETAYSALFAPSFFLLVFVGVLTGVGGGVLRDVLAGDTPYIFVKHFYATASLIGALVAAISWSYLGELVAIIVGAAVVTVLRLLAARFRWRLPRSSAFSDSGEIKKD